MSTRPTEVFVDAEIRRLADLAIGDRGRLSACDLTVEDRTYLEALGCADRSRFRLRQSGSPWIVQVGATRIGLSEAVASRLRVLPEKA